MPADSPPDETAHLHLHYTAPAQDWSSSLPVGNGRLGGSVYGRTGTELIQLNEDSVWYGGPQNRVPREAHVHLPRLRQLIHDHQHEAAEQLVREQFFTCPASMRHYEPLGSCILDFMHPEADVTHYRRHLDLATSQAVVQYFYKGISCERRVIASRPDNALLMRITASSPIRFTVRLDRMGEDETETNSYLDEIRVVPNKARIVLHATPGGKDSNRLCMVLGVASDDEGGHVDYGSGCLIVTSKSCTIAIASQTTYRCQDPEATALGEVGAALCCSWDQLVQRHQEDYTRLFGRVSLRMWPDSYHLPTDQRLRTNRDPGLVALYHNYGRYLLISCSRAGYKALPATLQGIWSTTFAPPWGSKYTLNINLEMNYWPVAMCGLVDQCLPPVIDLLHRLARNGTETARAMYACRGWCAHHNTDIWADTSPQDRWMPATLWPLGGLWLTIDVIDTLRFQYSEAMHREVFPILEGCIRFLLDFMIRVGDHYVTSPSLSPENTFISKTGTLGIFCQGSTLDTTIIQIALKQFLWSIGKLSLNGHALEKEAREALSRLPPILVNGDGLIQEWGLEDFREHEPGHRHVSHLFGLYPGDCISPVSSPDLANAARKVLQRRAQHGGGHTGWSRAWLLNLHARLFDKTECGKHMDLLLETSTLPNLLDTHPPFQIDGNFGGCAGILECLIQSAESTALDSHDTQQDVVDIRLLPSCPDEWPSGNLVGVRTRGGWVVSFTWEDGIVIAPVTIHNVQADSLPAVIIFEDGHRTLCQPSEACNPQHVARTSTLRAAGTLAERDNTV